SRLPTESSQIRKGSTAEKFVRCAMYDEGVQTTTVPKHEDVHDEELLPSTFFVFAEAGYARLDPLGRALFACPGIQTCKNADTAPGHHRQGGLCRLQPAEAGNLP